MIEIYTRLPALAHHTHSHSRNLKEICGGSPKEENPSLATPDRWRVMFDGTPEIRAIWSGFFSRHPVTTFTVTFHAVTNDDDVPHLGEFFTLPFCSHYGRALLPRNTVPRPKTKTYTDPTEIWFVYSVKDAASTRRFPRRRRSARTPNPRAIERTSHRKNSEFALFLQNRQHFAEQAQLNFRVTHLREVYKNRNQSPRMHADNNWPLNALTCRFLHEISPNYALNCKEWKFSRPQHSSRWPTPISIFHPGQERSAHQARQQQYSKAASRGVRRRDGRRWALVDEGWWWRDAENVVTSRGWCSWVVWRFYQWNSDIYVWIYLAKSITRWFQLNNTHFKLQFR